MSEAPERIWAGMVTTQHYPLVIQRLWDVERFGDKTGYVRVDLYEQLQEEVERLRFIVRHLPEICETGVVPTAVAYVAAKMTKAELGALAQARGIGKSNSKRGDQ